MSIEPSAPPPRTGRRWSMHAVSRAVEGGVVLVGEDGSVDFVSAGTGALLGEGEDFEKRWGWIQDRIESAVDMARLRRDGEFTLDVQLPEDLGGTALFVRLLPVEDEECAGYLAICRDRRVLDALQSDLMLASQMRRIAVTLEQTAHDMKAPLNAMGLHLDMIRDEIDPEDADVRGQIDLVLREVTRLERMLQSAMASTRVPRRVERRFDLRRLAREVATLVRAQARAAGVGVDVETPKESLTVLGSRDVLKQALVNLAVNAVEAMPDGGHLSFRLDAADGAARLEIRDTGTGIPDAIRPRLFELHFTTKTSGSGIGLFTAREAIVSMGGRLELEDARGGGTSAVVSLPLAGFEPDEEVRCSTS